MPKVSVLMPVYKTPESYLRQAIDSILNQTFQDFEFLILDDCPEDPRENIVKSYSDARIKYIKNDCNLGITPSRNKLMDISQGEYLAIFDHDDISLPLRLEKQVAYLDQHPSVGVVGCWAQIFQDKNAIATRPIEDKNIKLDMMWTCSVFHSASMIRKSVLVENNIHYEQQFTPAEDYALWARLMPLSEFHNIPEVLFKYRVHLENTSSVQRGKMSDTSFVLRDIVRASNPDLYKEHLINTKYTVKVRIFGFIPFIKIHSAANKTKVYLFEFILLWIVRSPLKTKYIELPTKTTHIRLFGLIPFIRIKTIGACTKGFLFGGLIELFSLKRSIKLRD